MTDRFACRLNGFLAFEWGLTGTKVGCDTGECGSCVVLLNGLSVKSCPVLAVQAQGSQIVTIEGIGKKDGGLNSLQEAFGEEHAVQCGFCTSGKIMAMTDLLSHNPEPTEQEIREGLQGAVCRCTGYEHVVRAVERAVKKTRAPFISWPIAREKTSTPVV